MADIMTRVPNINFTNSRKAVAVAPNPALATPANYSSVTAMRARLQAVNASYFTNARLDSMTVNDMIFSLRNVDDATSISSHMTNKTA